MRIHYICVAFDETSFSSHMEPDLAGGVDTLFYSVNFNFVSRLQLCTQKFLRNLAVSTGGERPRKKFDLCGPVSELWQEASSLTAASAAAIQRAGVMN